MILAGRGHVKLRPLVYKKENPVRFVPDGVFHGWSKTVGTDQKE
jgi:hypothetical protein